ncbi:MAG: 5-methyltetrahydropteroyltriglutamate--homocysteine S-methyltransferase [Gemmataceae bacterium]
MVTTANLGFPRIGTARELKKALEAYWSEELSATGLAEACAHLRRQRWQMQAEAGLDFIPSNDFSLYDHVLDTVALTGAVPARYGPVGTQVTLEQYFAMARGVAGTASDRPEVPAMEMTKWFDTNYHYIVPEFQRGQTFRLASRKPFEEYAEALHLGIRTRPVVLGPVSFLLLGKMRDGADSTLDLLDHLLPVYRHVLGELGQLGAEWVQIDEPCLVLDLDGRARAAFAQAYSALAGQSRTPRIMLTTYFGPLRDNLPWAVRLPVAGLHLDVTRAADELDELLRQAPGDMVISLGIVDGRNVWRTDLDKAVDLVQQCQRTLGHERIVVAPSCSLLHVPVDLALETELDEELRSWLAFARQKLDELVVIKRALVEGRAAVAEEWEACRRALAKKRTSGRIVNASVRQRIAELTEDMYRRRSPYATRRTLQRSRLQLPILPTTTIGSFPQTREVRAARAAYQAGRKSRDEYEAFLRREIERAVRFQEEIGLDVLVHGEFERTDMVEYFAEQLAGIAVTRHGWVQSYGSRCVRPPIIYGDVYRPRPMTVTWAQYTQSLTERPVKGMLTGPVTILQWSFVRDDQPRSETCKQLALAIRDEVLDLEAAGMPVIQIDEPALREGLPLRREAWNDYLAWAVRCFRLASSGVRDQTQIHTHMCYSEFNDIIEAIADMDADVISIESSRSQMELLGAFVHRKYPNEIGPGVYDIHSPRVPSVEEMAALIRKALQVLDPEQVWVNPDCGLKTRRWEEVRPALANMVSAARVVRTELASRT